jgi:integrase
VAGRPAPGRRAVTAETHRQRMRAVRQFSGRIIEWDRPGAPARNPVIAWDIPKKPGPLPKFPGDRDAAKVMAAARALPRPPRPAGRGTAGRTGMRAGELANLDADAVVRSGAGHWLHIPLGKPPHRPVRAAAPRTGAAAHRLDRGQPGAHPPP